MAFETLQEICRAVSLSRPSAPYKISEQERAEKALFRDLLQSSDSEAAEVLKRRHEFTRPMLHHPTGTMVLDGYVRDRQPTKSVHDGRSNSTLPPLQTMSANGVSNSVDLNSSEKEPE